MHYLTVLLGSLLALLGYHEPQGQTSIIRVSGEAAVLSRTTVSAGKARFQCLQSESGNCFYRLYREDCHVEAAGELCRRQALDDFSVVVGRVHEVQDLPAGFGQQVRARKVQRRD
ncbi:MAG: hypothetical protein WA956_07325 [Stenotrophomonas sp.]